MGRPSVQHDIFEFHVPPKQNGNSGTNIDFFFFSFLKKKSYGESYGKLSEPGFPHNFTKNGCQDLKMGCIDVSRRQLQSVLKIGA
jgi:hypothetical protein